MNIRTIIRCLILLASLLFVVSSIALPFVALFLWNHYESYNHNINVTISSNETINFTTPDIIHQLYNIEIHLLCENDFIPFYIYNSTFDQNISQCIYDPYCTKCGDNYCKICENNYCNFVDFYKTIETNSMDLYIWNPSTEPIQITGNFTMKAVHSTSYKIHQFNLSTELNS